MKALRAVPAGKLEGRCRQLPAAQQYILRHLPKAAASASSSSAITNHGSKLGHHESTGLVHDMHSSRNSWCTSHWHGLAQAWCCMQHTIARWSCTAGASKTNPTHSSERALYTQLHKSLSLNASPYQTPDLQPSLSKHRPASISRRAQSAHTSPF